MCFRYYDADERKEALEAGKASATGATDGALFEGYFEGVLVLFCFARIYGRGGGGANLVLCS